MKPVYRIYIRVSTPEQKNNYSPEHQKKMLMKHQPDGFDYKIYREVESGKTIEDRPVFQKVISDLQDGDIMAVLDTYRFGRTRKNLDMLELIYEKGAKLSILGEIIDPNDEKRELYFGIESLIGNFQRKYQLRRSRAGMQAQRELGQLTYAKKLYGWNRTEESGKVKIDINPEEEKVIRYIFTEYSKGTSINSICKYLNNQGIRRRGELFRHQTTQRMLCNPIYTGNYYKICPQGKDKHKNRNLYNPETFDSDIIDSKYYDAIIPIELFKKCMRIYRNLPRKHTRQYPHRYKPYVLTSLIKCEQCGSTFVHTWIKYKSKGVSSYRTIHKMGCECKIQTLNNDVFTKLFSDIINIAFLYPADIANHLKIKYEALRTEKEDIFNKIQVISKEISDLEKEQKHLMNQLKKIDNTNRVITEININDEKIEAYKSQIAQLESNKILAEDYYDDIVEEFKEDELSEFDSADEIGKNQILQKYVSDCLLDNDFLYLSMVHGLVFVVPIARNSRGRVLPKAIYMLRDNRDLHVFPAEGENELLRIFHDDYDSIDKVIEKINQDLSV